MPQVVYYAFLDKHKLPGVFNKIKGAVCGLNEIGYEAEKVVVEVSLKGIFNALRKIFSDDSDVMIFRYYKKFQALAFPFLIVKRMLGTKVIIDVPTPRVVAFKERKINGSPWYKYYPNLFIELVFGALIFLPANKIIQYADEGIWFSFGLKHKTLKMGNGIYISPNTSLVKNEQQKKCLNLIAVASIAKWHGYDRLIKAMAKVKQKDSVINLHLTLVGDGKQLAGLKALTSELGLSDSISFTGYLQDEALDVAFINANLGVASLGLFRIGLSEASVLKTREYMSRGLCVLGVGDDPDFSSDSPYRFVVPNSEETEQLAQKLIELSQTQLPKPEEVRKFAEEKLSYTAKMKVIMSDL